MGKPASELLHVPDHMTLEKTMTVTSDLIECVSKAMEDSVAEVKKAFALSDDKFKLLIAQDEQLGQSLMQIFGSKQSALKEEILKKNEVTKVELQAVSVFECCCIFVC